MIIQMLGVNESISLIKRQENRARDAAVNSAAAAANHVKEIMQREELSGQTIDVETGALHDSWYVREQGTPSPEAVLGSQVPYARAQNYGTVRLRPRLFLNRAIETAKRTLHAVIAEGWKR